MLTIDNATQLCQAWSKIETLSLIQLYSVNMARFANTTEKAGKIWASIAVSIPDRSVIQIRNWWKYLKKQYTKVKDNMGPWGTGTKRIVFPYFEAMDALFRRNENIVLSHLCDLQDSITPFPSLSGSSDKSFKLMEDEDDMFQSADEKMEEKAKKINALRLDRKTEMMLC